MQGLSNKTKITLITTASAGTTGSIQKIYAPQGALLTQIQFGYWERVGTTGSKAIITDTFENLTSPLTLESNSTLDGPIVSFILSQSAAYSGSIPVLVYSNNVQL